MPDEPNEPDAAHPRVVEVPLKLPSLFAAVLGGRNEFTVRAANFRAALEDAVRTEPRLRSHLFEPDGQVRWLVLCVHNGVCIPHEQLGQCTLRQGDALRIVGSVTGG